MFIYLHVIRLYWKWHTCIPYAPGHPRIVGVVHETSLEKKYLGGLAKNNNNDRRVVHTKNINRLRRPN